MVFPVVMYGSESWTVKKAEHRRIDAFKLWCWRRFLRVLWTARRSNQSVLKGINPEYSLEGLTLTLKFQYFGHLIRRADSLERTWCWETKSKKPRKRQRMKWFYRITDSMNLSLSKVWEIVKDREVLGATVHSITKRWTWLSDWTTAMHIPIKNSLCSHVKPT